MKNVYSIITGAILLNEAENPNNPSYLGIGNLLRVLIKKCFKSFQLMVNEFITAPMGLKFEGELTNWGQPHPGGKKPHGTFCRGSIESSQWP